VANPWESLETGPQLVTTSTPCANPGVGERKEDKPDNSSTDTKRGGSVYFCARSGGLLHNGGDKKMAGNAQESERTTIGKGSLGADVLHLQSRGGNDGRRPSTKGKTQLGSIRGTVLKVISGGGGKKLSQGVVTRL